MDKRRSCANCSSTDHHVSACPTYKQGMKAIGFSLEDEDASELDHEDFMRGVIAKFGPRCFFCNLEGHFKSECPQFWDAVADIKHPRHEEALSGWCSCSPEPNRYKISKIFSAVSCCYFLLAIKQFRAVPSNLLVRALHSCLSDKSSSSKCSFITSIQVSIQP